MDGWYSDSFAHIIRDLFWPWFVVVFCEVNWGPLVLVCERVVVFGAVIVFVNWIGFCRSRAGKNCVLSICWFILFYFLNWLDFIFMVWGFFFLFWDVFICLELDWILYVRVLNEINLFIFEVRSLFWIGLVFYMFGRWEKIWCIGLGSGWNFVCMGAGIVCVLICDYVFEVGLNF